MAEPIAFATTTDNFALPLLFQGQAQKEFFFNESMSMIDTLLLKVVEGEISSTPSNPLNGQAWLVAPGATGAWQGKDASIAVHFAGSWTYISAQTGMILFDKAANQIVRYDDEWTRAATPSAPTGGTVVDQESRAAIDEILAVLRNIAAIPAN